MQFTHYAYDFEVNQPIEAVFNKINDVAAWWSTQLEGESKQLHDHFTVRFGETFYTIRVTTFHPYDKITWTVANSHMDGFEEADEWNGTRIHYRLHPTPTGTLVHMEHEGLIPGGVACFDICEKGWNFYLKESLVPYLSDKAGLPT
ncbi:activator of Hsp90 ATPase-like protein [Chitinophaga skermanii]|uniref:Activator of Hsp90 ATPase-like protein n=1 Tax=Chitinophaga skermanii TaxID=331697 RepID=A0A327Q911_9BACT|nr:SRPBCC domain-containing protein [Chitinophaga skermanii]RAJ00425.1 activator of Hsp90 ATPase-like protein [Chitinophaga skermanii]